MPAFDLRYIKAAKYVNTNGVVTYSDAVAVGDAMSVDLQLKFAEGRLYAEGGLAEYLRLATGGTVSMAVKYLKDDAQTMLFGCRSGSRTVGASKTVNSMKYGANDVPGYVGIAFYAPDKIDGVQKYTCGFVTRALFGPPTLSFKTLDGNTVTFQTPTTSGEFLPDHSANREMIEVGIADTAEDAAAWVDLVLGVSS